MTESSRGSSAEGRSLSATAAGILGLGGVALALLGPALAHFRWLSPFGGFSLFLAGLVLGGVLPVLAGLLGLARTRATDSRPGRPGRGLAWLGLLLGVGLLGTLVLLVASGRGAPRIHDITTAPDDPPAFTQAARHAANRGRDLAYPHGAPQGGQAVPDLQRAAYPELRTLVLEMPPDEAFERIRRAMVNLGWTPVWSNRQLGVLEAFDESDLFRFVDDIVVRLRPADGNGGTRVDVRSTSRVGVGDFGANAGRIRDLTAALDDPY